MPSLKFDLSDNGRIIEASPDSRIELHLHENPTTGFRWQAPESDSGVATLERDTFVPRGGNAAGAGGTRCFVLYVRRPGQTVLRLASRRPWDKGKPPAALFQLTINAK
jgi:predicted secreted protein